MNPYVKILKVTRKEGSKDNPPTICIGSVISPPPNLIVQTQDTQLYNDDILIADYLLNGYSRDISILGGSGTKITMNDTLKVGDKLAIMPTIDSQTWIILCKVVSI